MTRKVRVRAVIAHNGKFLFVQHAPRSEYWALPGGHLEDGEALEDGVRRELLEELGVEPVIGRLLYVQQLFLPDHESLEFFFEVTNGADFAVIDLDKTTHGRLELSQAAFIDPSGEVVLPDFLTRLPIDMVAADWPKVYVSSAV